jgi:hypothetical protein
MGVPITILGLQYSDGYIHMLDNLSEDMKFEVISCCEPAINLSILKKDPKFKEYKSRQVVYNGTLCQKSYHRVLIKKV